MQEDTITRYEFKLYHAAQETERLIERIRNSLRLDYGFATLSGVAAGFFGSDAVTQIYQDNSIMAAIDSVLVLFNIGCISACGKIISDKYEMIERAEEILERIRENPAYKNLFR